MLPADIAQAIRRIQFVTGRQVADVMSGAYLSVFKGRGMEFDEVRPYVPGDDVRAIDWNVTARTGEPHIKRFVEERELTVMLVVDVSASQEFGSRRRSKLEAAAELSALLALSAAHSNDKIGLLLFHGAADRFIPPRKGAKHALRVVREVLTAGGGVKPERAPEAPGSLVRRLWGKLVSRTRTEPRRATNIAAALEFCRGVLPRRTVLFLISDFIDDDYLTALRLANRRHDVIAALVSDAREHDLPASGLVVLQDAETGERRLVDTGSQGFRDGLHAQAAARLAKLTHELRSSGVDLVQFDSSDSMVEPLLRFFRERQHRRARR